MAVPKTARLVRAEAIARDTRLLDFALPEGERLGFAGGQYVIVDSGIPLPGGKIAKRAYSIVSPDEEQGRFRIAVRRIAEGPGSNYMHALPEGAELRFSGPWGKFVAPAAEPSPCLVLATDTGITAALGLLQGAAFRPWLAHTTVIWFVESPEYFVPESFVLASSAASCASLSVEPVPRAGHVERPLAMRARLGRLLEGAPPQAVYLAGDGDMLYPAAQDLTRAGVPEGRISIECFFNNPARKAA
jgi:ferredoxin-NADP reductase